MRDGYPSAPKPTKIPPLPKKMPSVEKSIMPDGKVSEKLSHLRQDVADALGIYLAFQGDRRVSEEQVNVAALGYVNAQTKYTLACAEVQMGPILPYVEVDHA
jgi:hypothetical protein